jgi:hypothetical protein
VKDGNGKWLRRLVYAAVAAVAVFSFIVSYSHIYDLGRSHAQFGAAARLLPLSVDVLIVAASLVLFIQYRETGTPAGLARWLPRLTLYAAIGATVAANVFYGLPFGWLAAVISGWPGAAFVAAVEVGMVIARPALPAPEQNVSAGVSAQRPAGYKPPPQRAIMTSLGVGQGKARQVQRLLVSEAKAAEERSRGGRLVASSAPAAQDAPAGTSPHPAGVLNGRAHG